MLVMPQTLAARFRASYQLISGRARYRLIAGAAVCAIAVAGCGSATAPGSGGAAAAPKVSLKVTVTGGPGTAPAHWTLRCDPAGGTHPDPAAACKGLLEIKKPFAPKPARMICPMIMISSKQVILTGTWFGQKVHRIVIDGGCDVSLFSQLDQVFH